MTDFVVPDSITPIEGWRVWLYAHPHFLQAAHSHAKWPHREVMQAECFARRYTMFPYVVYDGNHEDGPPAEDCTCGIYAHKLPYQALRRSNGVSHVVGRVALWGTVREFERGYRAEYAYPLELWLPLERKHPGIADALEASYGVPVHQGVPE